MLASPNVEMTCAWAKMSGQGGHSRGQGFGMYRRDVMADGCPRFYRLVDPHVRRHGETECGVDR